jgi:hypothetical protein
MASRVLCLNKTRIFSLRAHPDLQATLFIKFNLRSCYDGHGTIMLFHNNTKLSKSCTLTDSDAEFITTLFNGNTSLSMNIITTYKTPKMQLCHCFVILKNILEIPPTDCSIFILGDLKVDMLIKNLFFGKHY